MEFGKRIYTQDDADEPIEGQILALERSDPLTVETVSNHIYFYSYVNTDRSLALIKQLRDLDMMLRTEHLSRNLPKDHQRTPIWLHIHSGGGELFTGLSLADQIKQIDTPIYSVVEGYCASAATMISMSCSRRFIQPSAFMLIHQLSAAAWGTYEQMKDDMHLYDMAMNKLIMFYKKNSNLKKKQIEDFLKQDSWFQADECIEHGFVDGLLES